MNISKAKLGTGCRFIVDVGRDPYTREKVLQNGSKLFLDPSYRPTWHAKIDGIVHAPYRGSDVERGEKLYFHYTCVEMDDSLQYVDGDLYLMVPSDLCFFAVSSNGRVRTLNSHIGILPYKEEPKVLSNGLYATSNAIKSEKQGLVIYHSDKSMVGKKVLFHPRNAFENEIEGQKLYVMQEDDLLAVIDDWLDESTS